jgi:hypothetical protein
MIVRRGLSGLEIVVWALIISFLVLPFVMSPMACKARWAGSEYKTRWTVLGSCQVSKDSGKTWIPEKNLRELD